MADHEWVPFIVIRVCRRACIVILLVLGVVRRERLLALVAVSRELPHRQREKKGKEGFGDDGPSSWP